MIFPRADSRIWRFPWSSINYAKEVGDPADSSIVAAVLLWVARTFPEAPPMLSTPIEQSTEFEAVQDHPLLRLLQRPNDYYSGSILWMATTIDWMANGDAYWIILPSPSGRPAEIWYAPSWTIEPRGDDATFVDHYDYKVDGQIRELPPSQVVHFRYGLDSENPRKGCSPLRSVLREIFTDQEAAAYTASILRNVGVPGLIVSPEQGFQIDEDEARQTKQTLLSKFSGERRGEPMVLTGPTRVAQFGFSPEQLLLKELRRIPEERVSAVTGIPAIVAGLGAGLDRSTFTNMGEARVAAYEAGLIPMQRILAEEIRFQLLPLFDADPFAYRFGFDLTKVRCLQEDVYRQAQRLDLAYRGGWLMRSEARRGLGYPVEEERDNVFILPPHTALLHGDTDELLVSAQSTSSAPSPPPPAPATNGHRAVDELELAAAIDRRELTRGGDEDD
jgi:HK97 family phage portal protein